MVVRTVLTAALLLGCTTASDPEPRTSDIEATSDSDDYSEWFEGMSLPDIEDFERQFDADQLQYPSEIPEPEHEPGGPSGSSVRSAKARPTVSTAVVGIGSAAPADAGVDTPTGSDAGFDASTTVDAGTITVDAGPIVVDAGPIVIDASIDASIGDAAICGTTTNPAVIVDASLMLSAPFNVSVGYIHLGNFGPVRRHDVWARGNANGTANLTLSGSLTATTNGWTATISVNGMAQATASVSAVQQLTGPLRSQWFDLGNATLSGNVSFADSVTFTQTCNPPGVVATTPGTPAITVGLVIDDAQFYGYLFPRLQGPVATRIRGALAQFARNLINRRLPGLIGSQVFAVNQAYADKKSELLAKLVAKIPQGCGCALAN